MNKKRDNLKFSRKFKDSDGDGLSDYDEVHYFGSDPYNADSDGDGIEDGEAVLNGRDPVGGGRLKNFFIPHAGNNYEPSILRTKRIVFHTLSLITIKLIVVAFIIFYPLTAWLSTSAAYAQTQKIIVLTNNLRSQVHLVALKENTKLDDAAYEKVNDMLVKQYFAHVSPSGLTLAYWIKRVGYNYSTAGENLAIGYATAEEVVAAWRKSPEHYSNIIDPNFKDIGVAMSDGRFDKVNTVMVAQYFARPMFNSKSSVIKLKTPLTLVKKIIKPVSGKLTIKGDNFTDAKVIKAAVSLPPTTVAAKVIVSNKIIKLNKASSTSWTGTALVSNKTIKKLNQPLVPATIDVQNSKGVITQEPLDWTKIKPVSTSPLERYNLFREQPSYAMLPVLIASNVYFEVMLFLAIIAFALNIFIEIKKQKSHLIFKSLGMIVLLVLLIIF